MFRRTTHIFDASSGHLRSAGKLSFVDLALTPPGMDCDVRDVPCGCHNVTGCEIGSRASMVRSLEDLLQGPCPFQQPRPVASDSSAVRWGTGERGNGRRSRAKARLSQGPVQGHRPTHLDTKNPCHTFVFQEFVLNKSQRKND